MSTFKSKTLAKADGFTLLELLIVVVIIGLLAAVGFPVYTRYITSAKAAEAHQMLSSVITHYKSYQRAHGRGPEGGNCDTTALDGEWIDEVIGDKNQYFEFYYYNIFGWDFFRVRGKASPFTTNDQMFYFPNTNIWLTTGRLRDIQAE